MPTNEAISFEFHHVTPGRWQDFESLFGEKGACGGCWCMWWRLSSSEFTKQKGDKNREAIKKIIHSGQVPGILAYHKERAVAWCSFGPREHFPRLENSRILRRIDAQNVWSIVCFFIAKDYRKKGLSEKLLRAVIQHASQKGAKIIEGYPVEPKKAKTADVFVYTGLASTFRKVGFKEVARRSETRPIMRYIITGT